MDNGIVGNGNDDRWDPITLRSQSWGRLDGYGSKLSNPSKASPTNRILGNISSGWGVLVWLKILDSEKKCPTKLAFKCGSTAISISQEKWNKDMPSASKDLGQWTLLRCGCSVQAWWVDGIRDHLTNRNDEKKSATKRWVKEFLCVKVQRCWFLGGGGGIKSGTLHKTIAYLFFLFWIHIFLSRNIISKLVQEYHLPYLELEERPTKSDQHLKVANSLKQLLKRIPFLFETSLFVWILGIPSTPKLTSA